MIQEYAIVRESARHVADAALRTTGAFRERRVEQEPAFTDRMLGYIEEAMRQFEVKGVRWSAKTLTDRGPGSQEHQYGADFAGVLSIDLPGFAVKKGFLAQAKLIEPGEYMSPDAVKDMRGQCERMLDLSPDSFLFLYTRDEILVVPAISVVSSDRRNPHALYSRSVSRFYEAHFESFIGDRRIHAPTLDVLDALRRDLEARSLLYLEARGA